MLRNGYHQRIDDEGLFQLRKVCVVKVMGVRITLLLFLVFLAISGCTPKQVPGDSVRTTQPIMNREGATSRSAPVGRQDEKSGPISVRVSVYGFEGFPDDWVRRISGKGINVLERSVTATIEGKWRAWGLVRNEFFRNVGTVLVKARLFAQDGTLLAQPSATVLVDPLRPGEPGPFQISSTVGAAKVARVEWTAAAGQPNPRASRDLDIDVYWQVPFGVSEWKGVKREDPPYPHLMAAGARNAGVPLADATLVVAWVQQDPNGGDKRIVWLEETTMDDVSLRPIPPDGSFNFRVIQAYDNILKQYEKKLGPNYLYRLDYILWAVGKKAGASQLR